VDAEIRLDELDEAFFAGLEQLEPFGQENSTPVFMATGLRLRGTARVLKKKHLKFSVTDGARVVDTIWWGQGDAELPGRLDLAFIAERQEFRGEESVQLIVRDVRASGV
jgi:single-stranded-DNA-specific exonuclease